MSSKDNYIGTYLKKGNNLTGVENSKQLYIGTRKKTTLHKPTNFLIDKTDSQKGEYISSLYNIGLNKYKFDYKGEYYQLRFEGQQVFVEPLKQNAYV